MRYDFASDTATSTVSPGSYGSFYSPSLHPSGDRSLIGVSENGISSGPFSRVVDGALTRLGETNNYNSGLAVNADGAQFAIPTYYGTTIYAGAQKVKTLGRYADEQGIGAAYHPTQSRLYLPWRNSSQVRVYDASSFRQLGAYDFETTFDYNATIVHVSRDGSLLAATVPGGVRFVSLNDDAPRPLLAHGDNIDLDEDTSATFDLGYSGGTPGTSAAFAIISGPQRGTLSGQGQTRTYVPTPNANGADEFTFRVTQGTASSTARVFIDIRAINDAPVVANISATTRMGRAVQIKARATDVDSSYASFNWRVFSPPSHGSTTIVDPFYNSVGNFTYTPSAGFVGRDTFQIVANDTPGMGFYNSADALDSAPATVTVTVSDNGAPIANPDSYTVSASEPFSLVAPGVLANDTDLEGDALTAVFDPSSQPNAGTIALKADGSFTWKPYYSATPPAQVTFRYAASDATGAGDWTTVTLNVTPPVRANAQSISLLEDNSKAITLTGSGPGTLSYSVATSPTKGLLSGSAPNLVYTPFPNYSGSDSFLFEVQNDAGKRATATVTIQITPVADIPIAYDGEADIEGETATTIWLRAFDGDDNALTFAIVGNAAHGTLTPAQISGPNNMKAYVYRAESGYVGDDLFTFRANDGYYTSNTATMRLHVRASGSGAAPVAVADAYSVARGQTLRVGAPGILSNDSDAAGAPLRAVLDRGPTYSSLFDFKADGSFSYAGGVFPWQDNYASDSFTYHVSNGARNSASVTVTLNIAPIAATPGALTLEANSSAAIALEASGPRPLGYLVSAPAHGILSGTAPGLTYTPATDYWGEDSFSFRAQSGDLISAPATISIRVLAPWSVADSTVTARAGQATPFQLNVSDAGQRAKLSIETPPLHGTISGVAPNLIYTANADTIGPDSLTFAATVGATRRTATVTFDVTPSNRAPVATAQSVTLSQDDEIAILLAGTDADGDALSFAVVREPAHGTLSGAAPDLIYTPDAGYFGSDSFGFTVSDGALTSASAEVSIRVTYVSYTPVARADAYQTLEDQPLDVDAPGVLANDSDANGDALTAILRAQPAHGQVVLRADGGFTYTPDSGYFGDDGFSYAASDGTLISENARVSIRVIHVNHAPVATPQNVATDQDTPLDITLSGTDVDGDALSFEIVSGPQNGALSGTGASLAYRPAADYFGDDGFTFVARDGGGLASAPARVTLSVEPVNDAPTFALASSLVTVKKNSSAQSVANFARQISPGNAYETAQTLTFSVSSSNDSLFSSAPQISPSGTLTYAPGRGRSGTATVTVTLRDDGGTANGGRDISAPLTFKLTVK